MNLYEALCGRKYVRRYKMQAIDDNNMEHLLRFAKSLPMLFPDIMVEFKVLDCTNEDNIKLYFNGIQPFKVKAPYYLILSSTTDNGYYINAGYLMEQVSLYLTTKGIGSCFLGAVKLSDEVSIPSSMEHVITLAFGESKSNICRTSGKVRRLPEEDTVTYKEEVNESVKTIIKGGRMAPSSMNSQPWRFVAYKNRIHVFCKKNMLDSSRLSRLKLIDIGVAIGNMLVVIDEMWFHVDLVRSDNISKQHFKNYDYILTLKLSSNFQTF